MIINKRAEFLITADAGNTNTSFVLWSLKTGKIKGSIILFNKNIENNNNDLKLKLNSLFNKENNIINNIIPFIISSVNPEINRLLSKTFSGKHYNLVFLKKQDIPLKICRYRGELGIDRLISGYAANCISGKNTVLISIGTAITIDVIKNNRFEGGVILPGPDIMLRALNNYTKKIRIKELTYFPGQPGKSTKECVSAGITCGLLYAINNFSLYFKKKLSDSITILTGGQAKYFLHKIENVNYYEPAIIHKGIFSVFNSRRKNNS